jgi:peptidoglycan-associated lipoprotein
MKKFLIILLLFSVIGCAKKYVKAPEEAGKPVETAAEEAVEPEVETEVVEEMVIAKEKERVDETFLSPEEEAKSVFKDVLFDYDKYNIREDARPVLNTVASFLNDKKNLNIVIEGHCDERGTNEYNLALGERRSKATKNYLVSLGVSPARMIIITYGEEKPGCMEQNESCWQSNRRAHFVIVK